MTLSLSPVVQSVFLAAVRLHQSGQLFEAERLYRQVLSSDPRHADSLHLLGVIATQSGHPADSEALIRAAIAQNDQIAPFHSNLGTSLRALGRLDEAAECYREAIRLKPDYPDAHNHLGTTLRDLGQLAAAEASYREAIRLKEDYADAHGNLGNLLRETHRLPAAEISCRRAVQLTPVRNPKLVQLMRNLGAVLRDQKRLTEAEEIYWQALQLAPGDAENHSNRGTVLRDLDHWTEAERCYRRALALRPDNAEFQTNLSLCLSRRGRVGSAETLCRRALAISPDYAPGRNALGGILYDLGQVDAARAQMQRALELTPEVIPYHLSLAATNRYRKDDPHLAQMVQLLPRSETMTPDDQLHLRFALAKAYEDAGDQEAAFAQLLEANRLKRGLMDYDERAMEDLFARIKATFTEERMNSRGARIAPAEGPIFIVGMMRSGSTLVEQILASHPQVFGAGELTLFKQAMSAVIGRDAYPTKAADLSTEALRQLGLVYRESLQKEAPAVRRITDKFLHNFLYCGLIALALPDARILHTRRDPVDTCLSCFSKLFVGEHPYSYDLAELGRYYRAYDGLMAHWRQVLPAGMMLDVDYERVIDDLEGQARLILDFCGLPWDDAVLSFHQTARPVRTASALQVRQPIYKSAVGRWRPEEALLKPLLDALT